MCFVKRRILLLLWTMITIDGQRWYTATVIGNDFSLNKDNKKNEKLYTPVSTILHNDATVWDETKKSELNQLLQQKVKTSDTSTKIPFNTAVGPRPFQIEEKLPPRYEALKRNEMVLEDVAPKNNTMRKKLQQVVWFNRTVNHVNYVNSPKPRRKIVKRCPPMRTRQKKQLGEKSRFLDIFHVVEFQNVPCMSINGLDGICLHQYECKTSGGISMGDCADGYGTCCVNQFSCGDQTNAQASWFTNPGYPQPSRERLSCSLTLNKASEDIQQIRLDFLSFELLPPTEGSCEQDQFVVTGQNINNIIPTLCGINNGQQLYIEVGAADGPLSLSIQSVVEESRLFAIKITQLTAFDDSAAPTNCLQYFKEKQGILESFNYHERSTLVIPKSPSYLNNLNYAMCIERAPDACSITYTNSGDMEIYNYDADGLPLIPPEQAGAEIFNCPSDWLLMSALRLCGDRLNDGSVFQDFSMNAPVTDTGLGPIVVWFRTDGSYVGRGFRLQYQQNPCLNPA